MARYPIARCARAPRLHRRRCTRHRFRAPYASPNRSAAGTLLAPWRLAPTPAAPSAAAPRRWDRAPRRTGLMLLRRRAAQFLPSRSGSTPPEIEGVWKVRTRFRRRWNEGSRREAERLEAREPAAFGLVSVDGKRLVIAAAGMGDVIRAAAQRARAVFVPNLALERHVGRDGGVECMRCAPGAITDAADGRVNRRRRQRHTPAVDQYVVPSGGKSANRDLEPFDGAVNVTNGAAGGAFLA